MPKHKKEWDNDEHLEALEQRKIKNLTKYKKLLMKEWEESKGEKEKDKEDHMSYKYFISYMFKPHDGKPSIIPLHALPTATCEMEREKPILNTFDVNDLEEEIRADNDYEFVMVIAFSKFE